MDLKRLIRSVAKAVGDHSPEILTGLGIVGFGTTVVMVAKAAPTVDYVHSQASFDRQDLMEYEKDEELKKDLVRQSYIQEAKEIALLYGPAAGVGIMSVACFLGAHKLEADRRAAILAAYSLSEKTLTTYQEKVIEKLGEEAHQDILDETTKEIVRRDAPEGEEHILAPNPAGTVRCYDNVTGRYFYSSKDAILEAESAINKRLLSETRVNLQEFYYELGLEEKFTIGDSAGWDISSPYNPQMMDIWFTPMLDDEKNPVLAINYHVAIFDRQA
jgi:hypothetical protein